ncbi:MAG TPA: hypothetical protein VN132_14045 [Bdellovibrio sp.]|nr:hypothetical protein [Bdellovibrio sp.]
MKPANDENLKKINENMKVLTHKPYSFLIVGATFFIILFLIALLFQLRFGAPMLEPKGALNEVTGKVTGVFRYYSRSRYGGSYYNAIDIVVDQTTLHFANWYEFSEMKSLRNGDRVTVLVGENISHGKHWFWQIVRDNKIILPYERTAQLLQERVDEDHLIAKIIFYLSLIPLGLGFFGWIKLEKIHPMA